MKVNANGFNLLYYSIAPITTFAFRYFKNQLTLLKSWSLLGTVLLKHVRKIVKLRNYFPL